MAIRKVVSVFIFCFFVAVAVGSASTFRQPLIKKSQEHQIRNILAWGPRW